MALNWEQILSDLSYYAQITWNGLVGFVIDESGPNELGIALLILTVGSVVIFGIMKLLRQ